MRSYTVNGASNRLGCFKDLFDNSLQFLGHGPGPHDASRVDDVIKGDVAVVLDVLHLLAVTRGLLQSLDDEGRGRGDDVDGGLTVLDGQLDGDLQTLPVLSGLGDVVTDLLGGETKGTDLGGKSGCGGNFTTDSPQADDLKRNCIPINGGNCLCLKHRKMTHNLYDIKLLPLL